MLMNFGRAGASSWSILAAPYSLLQSQWHAHLRHRRVKHHPARQRRGCSRRRSFSADIGCRAVRCSGSTPSVTSSSGPTPRGCTKSFRNPSAPRPRSLSDSRWMPKPSRRTSQRLSRPARWISRSRDTVTLLKLNAVVGLKGTVTPSTEGQPHPAGDHLRALPFDRRQFVLQGHRQRKDGWPNRDLNVGAIIALSPAITAAQKAVYKSWGPGKYDPRYNIDGKSTPLVLPPAYGLAG